MTDENGSGGDPGKDGAAEKIKVGDKEYSTTDVENLVSQVSSMTAGSQQLAQVKDFCDKYNLDTEGLLVNAEGAFGLVNDLMKGGIIDAEGNVLVKKGGEPPPDDLMFQKKKDDITPPDKTKVDDIVAKALSSVSEKIDAQNKRMDDIIEVQTGMIRSKFEDGLKAKFPALDDEDVSKVFSIAMRDKTKTLWQHAETVANTKADKIAELRKAHAKEFGVDIEKFDENKLNEADGKGGGIASHKGKKFSFMKTGEGFVTPLQATQDYFKQVDKGE